MADQRPDPPASLHIGKYYPPHRGGMETYLRDLLEAFVRAGASATALVHASADAGSSSANDQVETQPRVLRVPVWATLLFTPLSPGFPIALNRLLRDERPDILHLHMPNVSAFWALLLPAARRLPWVVHWHSDVPFADHGGVISALYRLLYRPLERLLLKRADHVIATSPPYLDSSTALNALREKAVVIPLGISDPPTPERTPPEKPPGSPLRVIAIGRLTYYKGFEILLAALKSCPAVTLDLVGDGEAMPALTQLARDPMISDRVTLHGAVSDADRERLLNECDVLCLPSIERSEAFGMVLLEAMARGKPCVATDVAGSGMAWVVDHEQTGLIVAAGNAASLAKALNELQADRDRLASMGRAGALRFAGQFRIDVSAAAILALYGEVIVDRAKQATLLKR